VDAARGLPAVVYRRRGYDYGVIHLDIDAASVSSDGAPGGRVGFGHLEAAARTDLTRPRVAAS
jgi:hypothetical protein